MEKLFTLTSKDFDWEYYRASGKGGQNRNKRETAVKCIHRSSKSVGTSADERSQRQNRVKAFVRCCNTPSFKKWLKIEAAKHGGMLVDVQKKVDEQIKNVKVEVRENGKWKNIDTR